MTCDSCHYCSEGERSHEPPFSVQLVCKRYPPVTLPVATPQGLAMVSTRPNVSPNDKCGEYLAKLQHLN